MNRSRSSLLAFVVSLTPIGCDDAVDPPERNRAGAEIAKLAPGDALGGADVAGFERAVEARQFVFPLDHGPHPDFRTEWWYATGNLFGTEDGRRFGYQLTIFRNALVAEPASRESAWAMRDLWFAHFAVTDVAGASMRASERFSRDAFALAGARAEPFRVWLEDWEFAGGSDLAPTRVLAKTNDGAVAVELLLEAAKPRVSHGEGGLSPKSEAVGNASYYYSYTRMRTSGSVTIDGERTVVRGTSWFDREWSTSALGEGQVGWDWFALQLDDGRDLMLYRMRRDDGTLEEASAGSLVQADGTKQHLAIDDARVDVVRRWTSPATGSEYPVAWRVSVPSAGIAVEVEAVLDDQEHDFLVQYWEGAVDVREDDERVGVGYVEMTGYATSK